MHDCTGSVIAAAEITSLAQVCIYWFFLYIFTLFGKYVVYDNDKLVMYVLIVAAVFFSSPMCIGINVV